MVSELTVEGASFTPLPVLILVLVEDGLGEGEELYENRSFNKVLILVLVEDGLGVDAEIENAPQQSIVLILVLVEDGLGEQLLELAVSETVATKFLISLTFGDQKYVPFRALSRVQIYGLFL